MTLPVAPRRGRCESVWISVLLPDAAPATGGAGTRPQQWSVAMVFRLFNRIGMPSVAATGTVVKKDLRFGSWSGTGASQSRSPDQRILYIEVPGMRRMEADVGWTAFRRLNVGDTVSITYRLGRLGGKPAIVSVQTPPRSGRNPSRRRWWQRAKPEDDARAPIEATSPPRTPRAGRLWGRGKNDDFDPPDETAGGFFRR